MVLEFATIFQYIFHLTMFLLIILPRVINDDMVSLGVKTGILDGFF